MNIENRNLTPEIKGRINSWIRGALLGMIGITVLLLLAVGKWNWLWGWIYIALSTLAMIAHVIVLVPINPALLADRAGGLRQPGAKPWDVWLAAIASLAFFAIVIVAGLDERLARGGLSSPLR